MGGGPGAAHHLEMEIWLWTTVAAHSEFTRMLAEHGLFGAISISILLLSFLEYKKGLVTIGYF